MLRKEILEYLTYLSDIHSESSELNEEKDEHEQTIKDLELRLKDLDGRTDTFTNRIAPLIIFDLASYLFSKDKLYRMVHLPGSGGYFAISASEEYILTLNSEHKMILQEQSDIEPGETIEEIREMMETYQKSIIYEAHISDVSNKEELIEFYDQFKNALADYEAEHSN